MSEQPRRSGWKVVAVMIAALAGAAAIGLGPKLDEQAARAEVIERASQPRRVRVTAVYDGPEQVEVTLPATAVPRRAAVLYSKSTGFVRRNAVDIGDRVQAGQLLAEIDAPETNEEIRLAKARLAEARANVGIVDTTSGRLTALAEEGAASQQEADDARAQANSANALVATRKADLQRLEVLRDYQHIVAPFAGIVTRRLVDPGALVGPASAGGVAMFEVAEIDTLRVQVDVPDAYADDVELGIAAEVYAPRQPARKVEGKVTRSSGVLTQGTRTLRIEIDVPGGDPILPGAFVYARLHVPRRHRAPVIPASALVVRKQGTMVARVDGGIVTMVPITIGRDLGKEIEVVDGLATGDQVVLQPPDTLETGDAVEVLPPAA